ncbi:MAG: hypothetical protein PHU46_06090 [Rhodocyclaceae bacterium]|nr:hypothetical protein [Rhodocyclaceae bacterium]
MNSRFPRRRLALCIAALLPAASALADPTYRMENRTELLNFDISGPGKAQSFYDPKAHVFHESDISVSNFKLGGWDGSLASTLRYTDSQQYDPDHLSLQKLDVHLKDAQNRIDMGDLFANLSPYSMMKGIKGAGFQHNFNDDRNYVRVAYGTFDGQWAYLLRDTRPDEPMDRYGGGMRVQKSEGNLTLGANLAQVADRADDPRRGNVNAYRQFIPAVDWEYRNAGMVLAGEHAYSDTDVTPLGSTGQNLHGSANRVSFRGAYRTLSLDGNLERVTPNYVTLGGGSTPDRMRLYARADWRMDRQWRLFGTYDRFYNDLDHQLATRTYNEIVEAGVTRQGLFDRRTASLSVSERSRYLWTDDSSSTSRSDRLRLKYKDRFLQDALDFGADYERMVNKDQRTTSDTHLANNLYNLSFGYRGNVTQSWGLRTNLDLGKSEVQNPTTGGFDVMDTARLSLVASHPDSTELGASYDLGNNSVTVIGSSSSQNRAMLYWSHRPQVLGGGSVRAEASINDYRFDDTTRNYREQLLRVVVNWNLEKKPAR